MEEGGKPDPGESLQEALRRETEETLDTMPFIEPLLKEFPQED